MFSNYNSISFEVWYADAAFSSPSNQLFYFAGGVTRIVMNYFLSGQASMTYIRTNVELGPSASNLVLQSSATIGADADWTPVPITPVLQNGRYTVTLPPTNSASFFRLQGP